jgi:TubC N-terminal docking domain
LTVRGGVEGLLERLGRLDIHLSVHKDQLELDGPVENLSDDLVDELRTRKDELLEHLGAGGAATRDHGQERPSKGAHHDGGHQPGFWARLIGDPADDDPE